MKFYKGILQVLHVGTNEPIQQEKPGPAGWKAALLCSEQAGHEAAVCPGSREGQWPPGLCWELCQVKGRDSSPLLSTRETTPSPALAPQVQRRSGSSQGP